MKLPNILGGFQKGQVMEDSMRNAFMFGVLVIATGILATVLSGVQAGQTAGSYAANISGQGLLGLNNFSGLFDDTGTVLGAVLILGILIGGLYFFFARKA